MDTFGTCAQVNDLLTEGDEAAARMSLVQLLDGLEDGDSGYGPLVNSLVRATGLYPYMDPATAAWQDRLVYEAFKVDVGLSQPAVLHREQSALLRRLTEGEDLAISAPTSFGKSFVIDAFIAITEPRNVVIIVPTLALTDETRRRLHRKFGARYKVITTANVDLADRNILVFPQERAPGYVDLLDEIDLLVVDEFYKASPAFDRDRSPSLLWAILQLQKRAKQRYYLAPNISAIGDSPFTHGMTFERLDFNTVYLQQHRLFEEIGRDQEKKRDALLQVLRDASGKTLIYAGTYTNIARIATIVVEELPIRDAQPRLDAFANWLSRSYDPSWTLTSLVRRGVGIHNGQLHRSLAQIQVRLFEEPEDGLDVLIATTSIVEGVNTSAENVVLWSNRKGNPRLDDFTYKNIMGRGGRMFRHFVGKIFILEAPPEPEEAELQLEMPDELLGGLDQEADLGSLSDSQVERMREYKREMRRLVGDEVAARLEHSPDLDGSDWTLVHSLVGRMTGGGGSNWEGLRLLNIPDPAYWDQGLYKLLELKPGAWDAKYSSFVAFVKALSKNWDSTIPELLFELDEYEIGIEQFFKLERNVAFKLAALCTEVTAVAREVLRDRAIDISSFAARVSTAFLPPLVYQLEEYGLPRMLSRRIHDAGVLDLTETDVGLHDILAQISAMGAKTLAEAAGGFDDFEVYLLEYFVEGVSVAGEGSLA